MKIKLSVRLWMPTIVLLVMMTVMTGIAAVRTKGLIQAAGEATRAQQTRLTLAHQWQGALDTHAVRVAAGQTGADLEAGLAQMQTLQGKLKAMAQTPEESALLTKLADRPATADALGAYRSALADMVKLEESLSEALHVKTSDERMRTVWLVAAVSLIVSAVLAVAAVILVRTIVHPLADLARAARRIGDGDLSVNLPASRPDEIGDVMRAVLTMRDGLRAIVGQVQQSASHIHHASHEVSMGNNDLSQRTERAAGNLQRATSGMQSLSSDMHHSASSAEQADALASNACEIAQRGGEAVAQVVTTMEGIHQASRRINDIIGVIDGIAFQTNILALNAAVEAARAGEQGRGFAVVASEVRNLAGRSAEAAKEIKSLIGASVEQVESGTRQVQDAGATMGEIVQSVQRVSQMIRDITQETRQHSQGVAQLHDAVSELDQMTQQNAALVEQSAAAAESLNSEAGSLSRVVSTFRMAPSAA